MKRQIGEETKEFQMKQLVLDAAVRLFEQFGYKNVNVVSITDEIGMTTGTFYYYFRSKEEILEMIYDDYITLAVNMIKEICEIKNQSSKEKMYTLIKTHCEMIHEYYSHVSVFFREYRNLSNEALLKIKQKNSIFLTSFQKLIQQGVDDGFFEKDLNPKIVSLAIIGMCSWLYQWYNVEGELSVDDISEIFYKLISSGLLKACSNEES